uniref:Uncharacterized protein n=1 Tax=Trichogramma kaykai TaxID=54128 RepID=A0ABD2X6V6_9HYME
MFRQLYGRFCQAVCASPRRAFMKNCILTSNCLVSLDVPYESGQVMKAASSREPGEARSRERNVCKLCMGPDYIYILNTEGEKAFVASSFYLVYLIALSLGYLQAAHIQAIRKNTFKISSKIRRKHDFLKSCTSMRR